MIAHPTVDVLSAHLDGELSRAESSRLVRHVDDCARCRHELEGLRRTVGRLRELEREAPSDLLETRVQRLVSLERDERSLESRLALRRFRLPVASSTVLSFSLVFAFAAILYVFAHAVERQRSETIPVDLRPRSTAPAVETPSYAAGEERMVWTGDRWIAESVETGAYRPGLEVHRGSPEWEELLRHHPELDLLPHRDGATAVRFHEGERLLVLP